MSSFLFPFFWHTFVTVVFSKVTSTIAHRTSLIWSSDVCMASKWSHLHLTSSERIDMRQPWDIIESHEQFRNVTLWRRYLFKSFKWLIYCKVVSFVVSFSSILLILLLLNKVTEGEEEIIPCYFLLLIYMCFSSSSSAFSSFPSFCFTSFFLCRFLQMAVPPPLTTSHTIVAQ